METVAKHFIPAFESPERGKIAQEILDELVTKRMAENEVAPEKGKKEEKNE